MAPGLTRCIPVMGQRAHHFACIASHDCFSSAPRRHPSAPTAGTWFRCSMSVRPTALPNGRAFVWPRHLLRPLVMAPRGFAEPTLDAGDRARAGADRAVAEQSLDHANRPVLQAVAAIRIAATGGARCAAEVIAMGTVNVQCTSIRAKAWSSSYTRPLLQQRWHATCSAARCREFNQITIYALGRAVAWRCA